MPTMRKLHEGSFEERGAAQYAPIWSGHADAVVLTAGTPSARPIPSGARFVSLSFDGYVWAKLGLGTETIAVPAASTTDGEAPQLAVADRRLPIEPGVTHVLLVAPEARKGSLAFWG